MKYEIKNFENQANQKLVGFWITDATNKKLAIDKLLPLVDGKTNEQYIQEAVELCNAEIQEWQQSLSLVGKVWDLETNSFK
jgi:hypothetical protein